MTPEMLIATFCEAHSIDLRSLTPGTGDKWTADDAAIACSAYLDRRGRVRRLSRAAESAFRYRWAGDYSTVITLRRSLLAAAHRMQRRESWPKTVPRLNVKIGKIEPEPYIADLVDLAITEERYWWFLKKHGLWHVYMRVQPFVWRRTLSGPYEELRRLLDEWCGDARYHIRRKLRHV